MITLGGVPLHDRPSDMLWVERYATQQGEQSLQRTLGGVAVIYSGPVTGGLTVTLRATESRGWLRRSVVEQLIVLAASVNTEYTLDFNGDILTVMFNHTNGLAVDMQPVGATNDDPDDNFIGDINLITV